MQEEPGSHSQIDAAIERYGESKMQRVCMQLLSALGGPVGEALSPGAGTVLPTAVAVLAGAAEARLAQLGRERLELFLDKMLVTLGQLDEEKVDWGFFQTPEFVGYASEAFEQARRATEDEVIEALSNAFVNGVAREGRREFIKRRVLRIAGELLGAHMRVLRVVYDKHRQESAARRSCHIAELQRGVPDLSEVDVRLAAQDLVALGLLRNPVEGGGAQFNAPQASTNLDVVDLTELGRKFARFIESPRTTEPWYG